MDIASSLINESVQAVRRAGELIVSAWDLPRNIKYKGPIDLVTDTDLAVEEHLKTSLKKILPEADFLAEESASETVLSKRPAWIIDPLDGTTNFAHKIPFVAVSVGLWTGSEVDLGIIYLPILNEMFWAARNTGAFCNDQPIRVSETKTLKPALIATGFPYSVLKEIDLIIMYMQKALVSTRGVRRCGSAATDLAYTAAGRFDAFYEIGLNPWDTAAGLCLIQEAGGRVTTFDGSPYQPGMREILGSNGHVHEQMSALLTADQ
ncbi:inositol monophosphatase family protein [Desulfonatronovibrio hydrogenovorans]|uniref:inositol monophosphatase family protein n=1 Tax=Desulfonatronovibrio hydrogenovorans TaxID=53245 RepID=UPI00048BFAB4|nr:inositol monophosphatase family protein [Desulfonatronovibrio hydrogenovorans]